MGNTSWERAVIIVLAAAALSACGSSAEKQPVFATAEPVAAAKPDAFAFRQAVRVRTLEKTPAAASNDIASILNTDDFMNSLRVSLANDDMLAPDDDKAEFELTPIFVDLRLAPVSDTITAAQAVFDYRVTRSDDGAVIFNRRVKAEFSSIADPDFVNGGMFGRALTYVGLREAGAPPTAAAAGLDEARAPGPQNRKARQRHAAHNAVALNIRIAMRQLVAASPERVVVSADETEGAAEGGTAPAAGNDPQAENTPAGEEGEAPTKGN